MANYFDFLESEIGCPGCSWAGRGHEARVGDLILDQAAEYCCPSCRHLIAVVAFPTNEERRTDPRANDEERLAAEKEHDRQVRFEATKLTSADQLPDLDPVPTALTLDWAEADGDSFLVVLSGEQEVWRELSTYGNDRRLVEIAGFLREKYGDQLRELRPTSIAEAQVRGSGLGSGIEAAQRTLRGGRSPLP